jgi:hypothetical protein
VISIIACVLTLPLAVALIASLFWDLFLYILSFLMGPQG